MAFLAGMIVATLAFLSIPALIGMAKSKDMAIKNWRLARTCVIGMGILVGLSFWMLNGSAEYTDMQRLGIVAAVIVFSIPAGVYLNTWFEHNVRQHEKSIKH